MEIVKGIAENIDTPIIGRIITQVSRYALRSTGQILLTPKPSQPLFSKLPVITTAKLTSQKTYPVIHSVSTQEYYSLNTDDIVSISSDGMVRVLWKAGQPHNVIYMTDRCNSRCIMCPQDSGSNEDYFPVNKKILELINPKDACEIGITGGEPTINPSELCEIHAICGKRFPSASISLLTNGRAFSNFNLTKKIVEVKKPRTTFCIPLYADNDIEHDAITGVKGSFQQTIRGIYNLAKFNQLVEIRVVIIKQNYTHLPNLAEFIYRNMPFVVHVAFMGAEYHGLARENLDKVWIDSIDYFKELEQSIIHLHQRAMNVSIYNIPLCLLPNRVHEYSRDSISTWKKSYSIRCKQCLKRNSCCGLFSTSAKQSTKISPF